MVILSLVNNFSKVHKSRVWKFSSDGTSRGGGEEDHGVGGGAQGRRQQPPAAWGGFEKNKIRLKKDRKKVNICCLNQVSEEKALQREETYQRQIYELLHRWARDQTGHLLLRESNLTKSNSIRFDKTKYSFEDENFYQIEDGGNSGRKFRDEHPTTEHKVTQHFADVHQMTAWLEINLNCLSLKT